MQESIHQPIVVERVHVLGHLAVEVQIDLSETVHEELTLAHPLVVLVVASDGVDVELLEVHGWVSTVIILADPETWEKWG